MQNADPFPLSTRRILGSPAPNSHLSDHPVAPLCILHFGFWISNFRNGPPVRSNEASASRGRELADADSGEFDCRTWGVEWN